MSRPIAATMRKLASKVTVKWGYVLAVILLLASVLVSQITGYYDRRDERAQNNQQVTALRVELNCRSRISGQVVQEQGQVTLAVGAGLAAIAAEDDKALADAVADYQAARSALNRALVERAASEDTCKPR
ncbi:hypothetical protein PO878_03860 [Iamia majanohamensis]|uniref:Uncharacterized protein n=1 Tax=Iamia majanohamensis TaxID=467976 RepID=A0AAE9YB47_9ACTN|nr:hypothetical protein [Iamia majanohamensis]WCO67858.1 hypothetical protein PO878_03860 [Iamia majanohamensis]